MQKNKRRIVLPTAEEDARIRAGIAADPDSSEIGEEQFARMRPASEVVPRIVERWRRARRGKDAPGTDDPEAPRKGIDRGGVDRRGAPPLP